MKGNHLILAALCCFVLFSTVKADYMDASKSMMMTSTVMTTYTIPTTGIKEEVFVDIDETHFYRAFITNNNDNIQIFILSQDLKVLKLVFGQPVNKVEFIDARQNFVIVKELDCLGVIVSYWVLEIVYDPVNCCFSLVKFAVNPRVDSVFFCLTPNFQITQIIELDVHKKWMAVIDQNSDSLHVYKINLAEQLNTLLLVGWFKLNGEDITGGNSRVLFDQAHNVLLVDSNNYRSANTPTIYNPVQICSLTDFTVYPKGQTFELIGYNFQYASQNAAGTKLTTFIYRKYGTKTIKGDANLISTSVITFLKDDYNFFAAISNNDVYLSNVVYDQTLKTYHYFGKKLSAVVTNTTAAAAIYNVWSKILAIVFIEDKFYFLSGTKFYVYGSFSTAFTEIACKPITSTQTNIWAKLFDQIDKYELLC